MAENNQLSRSPKPMSINRRQFNQLATASCLTIAAGADVTVAEQSSEAPYPVTDTHQHLWDLSKFRLAWLEGAPEVLRRDYGPADYAQATEGLNVTRAIYMEVDVVPEQHTAEAEALIELCSQGGVTRGAVISGRPSSEGFADYLEPLRKSPFIKGIRQVLHGGTTPAGYCLQPQFVRSIQSLGEWGLTFDLCMRPGELTDGVKLVDQCPDTQFIVDHCGNANPTAFRRSTSDSSDPPAHDPDQWRRDMEQLARRPNTACKISGIVASAPTGWTTDDLAPIITHCLGLFGADRVVFGGDWPVCLLGATYREWVTSLREIVAAYPPELQAGLWHLNATRVYRLSP
jgi:L-fuconolactonase